MRNRVVALLAVLAFAATVPAPPASADTATMDGNQGALPNHTLMTVSSNVGEPGAVLHVDVDASYDTPQSPCGSVDTGSPIQLGNGVEFYPADGPRPATDDVSDSLYHLPVTPQVKLVTTTQGPGCQTRNRALVHLDVTIPPAEDLRQAGLGDGPVRVFPIGGFYSDRDDPEPTRFTSGDVLKLTIRGVSAAPAPASHEQEIDFSGASKLPFWAVATAIAALVAAGVGLGFERRRHRV